MTIERKNGSSANLMEATSSFVATTEMMLELGRQGEWEQLAEMEARRRPELEAFFNSLDSNDLRNNSELLKQSIEKILALDNQIIALGAASKSELAELMQKSNSSRHAMSEYQKNTTL